MCDRDVGGKGEFNRTTSGLSSRTRFLAAVSITASLLVCVGKAQGMLIASYGETAPTEPPWAFPYMVLKWLVPISYGILAAAALRWGAKQRNGVLLLLAVAALLLFASAACNRMGWLGLRNASMEEIASGGRQAYVWLLNAGQVLALTGYALAIGCGVVFLCQSTTNASKT